MLWKCCIQYASKFGKLSSGHRTGKGQFSFQSQRKAMPKNSQTTTQLQSSQASNIMFKILQARLQQYVNCEPPAAQAGFRKGRGTRDQVANICWLIKKAREFQKNIYFCFIDYTYAFDCVDYNKLWKMEYQTLWPAYWEICIQVRKQQLELDMEQQTGSKLGKENVKAVYCHPAYLTSVQNTSWETLGWRKHKLESRMLGEISITSEMQMTPPLWQKVKRN